MNDVIYRQAAIDAAMKDVSDKRTHGFNAGATRAANNIKTLPPAQPKRKTGRWEMKPDPYGFFDAIPVCSECGCTTKMREKTSFCPHCGADMREV